MVQNEAILDSYRRYISGDERALGDVIKALSDSMLFFTMSIVKNTADSEEIVSDAFVHIAMKKQAFRGDSQLKTYLFAVCRNKAIDCIRKKSRSGEYVTIDDESLADFETLEVRVTKSERDEILHKKIAELCEDYRTALYLIYFEGLNTEECAKVMKKNRKQIENIVSRAKRALRALLENGGFDYEDL